MYSADMHATMRNTAAIKTEAQKRQWWESRQQLDARLHKLLEAMQDRWLGVWKVCFRVCACVCLSLCGLVGE